MRITFVTPTVNMSGGIRVVAIYAELLAAMGHSVCVVSPPPRPPGRRRDRILAWLGLARDRAPKPPSHLDGTSIHHHVLDRWRAVTSEDVPDADVVVATWWETAEWVSQFASRKGEKFYFIQGHELFPHLPHERVRATYSLPLKKIVIADWLRRVMEEEYGESNVDVVPNSVDRGMFFAPPRAKSSFPTIGLLYSRSISKGVSLATEAIVAARRRHPNLRVVGFGADPVDKSLMLPDGTEYWVLPSQAEIRSIYTRCDAWISASWSEGFNLPAMEAMACRTPVISTRTGWPAEAIISGRNGLLVEPGDVPGLTRGIEWICSLDNYSWQQLSERAFDTTTLGSWEESAKKLAIAFQRTIAAPRKP